MRMKAEIRVMHLPGTPETVGRPPRAQEGAWDRPSLGLRRTLQTPRSPASSLQTFGTAVSVVYATPFGAPVHGGPGT